MVIGLIRVGYLGEYPLKIKGNFGGGLGNRFNWGGISGGYPQSSGVWL